ncbi:hypothetical protein CRENBAI_009411 [Crenichthys baileyi]|uniref:Uncharacterized protein n=1 Tax=Crenichthys baileyi TaxID=28760 RepID=A0AAV9RMI2_9TELE
MENWRVTAAARLLISQRAEPQIPSDRDYSGLITRLAVCKELAHSPIREPCPPSGRIPSPELHPSYSELQATRTPLRLDTPSPWRVPSCLTPGPEIFLCFRSCVK